MKRQVKITLFGARGKRTVNVTTRGGFSTRHIKAPREIENAPPAIPLPEPTPPPPEPAAPSLLEILKNMEASENHIEWFILDEILFVANAHYKMKFNQTSLLDALRELYKQGYLLHRRNRFDQHTFSLIAKALPENQAGAVGLSEFGKRKGEKL